MNRLSRLSALLTTLGLSVTAFASNAQMCAQLEIGDIAACQAKVKATCKEASAWENRQCEGKIAPEFEQCGGDAFGRAAATGTRIAEDAARSELPGNRPDPEVRDPWLERANRIDAESGEYAKLSSQWKACTGAFRDIPYVFNEEKATLVADAPVAYHRAYEHAVDVDIAKATESMKAKGVDKAEGKTVFGLSTYWVDAVKYWQDFATKLPAAWRYKEAELHGLLTASTKNEAQFAAWQQAQIDARSCPPGPPLGEPYLAVARREFDSDKDTKRRVYRQGKRYQTRDGLISRDSVPFVMCTEHKDGRCGAMNGSLVREKPPGGAWTSWQLAVGSGESFNCKKW